MNNIATLGSHVEGLLGWMRVGVGVGAEEKDDDATASSDSFFGIASLLYTRTRHFPTEKT
jgi:hypothetical protein